MITKKELNDLFVWAKNSQFVMKKGPTANGYSNKPILFCAIKSTINNLVIKRKLINDKKIEKIIENDDILCAMIVSLDPGTELNPHRDPNIYKEPYKRIQIPLETPDPEFCYMIWRGKKVFWEENEPQILNVMDVIHEGYNYSDSSMSFLFIDVRKECELI
jgi:hypothetical protein